MCCTLLRPISSKTNSDWLAVPRLGWLPSLQYRAAAQVVSDQLSKVVFSGLYARMHAAFVTCCGVTQEDADACADLVRQTRPCQNLSDLRHELGAAVRQSLLKGEFMAESRGAGYARRSPQKLLNVVFRDPRNHARGICHKY